MAQKIVLMEEQIEAEGVKRGLEMKELEEQHRAEVERTRQGIA